MGETETEPDESAHRRARPAAPAEPAAPGQLQDPPPAAALLRAGGPAVLRTPVQHCAPRGGGPSVRSSDDAVRTQTENSVSSTGSGGSGRF